VRIGGQAERSIEASLIHQLRQGTDASRAELARRLEVAPSTIGQYVDRLIDDGYLLEGRKAAQPIGRWPTVVELNPRAGRFVGIDFDARQLMAVAVDFAQQPVRRRQSTIAANDSVETVIDRIAEAVLDVAEDRSSLLAVGVGTPGLVDPAQGLALHYYHLRHWQNVALADRLKERLGVPVFLENNIRAMALGEQLFGHARGTANFLCIGVRSGIAAGLVLNGSLYRGRDHLAGEIGQWACGRGRTLEQVASLKSISERVLEAVLQGTPSSVVIRRQQVAPHDLLAAAEERDELVCSTIRQAAIAIGKALVPINMLLNPQKIILAGPLAKLEECFIQPVREVVSNSVASTPHALPTIVASELGEFIGAFGGAALAAQRWEPVRVPRVAEATAGLKST
jgi:N-acetylglucosamine repressor